MKIINNQKSGLASVRNLGVELAIYSSILFIDNDIILKKNTITELIKLATAHPNVPINFNWIYPEELTLKITKNQFGRYLIKNGYTSLKGWSKGLIWDDIKVFTPDLMASYFLLITKDTIKRVGGYHHHNPQSAEDFQFAKQLKKLGIYGLLDPINIVYHNEEDRVELLPWLKRKEHSAVTRKVSFDLGYEEMALSISPIKKSIYFFIYKCKALFFIMLKIIPNNKNFDFIYNTIVNKLLTAYLYNGYYKIKP
jgi:GT2 family glycosyltransferase